MFFSVAASIVKNITKYVGIDWLVEDIFYLSFVLGMETNYFLTKFSGAVPGTKRITN